MAEYLEPGTHSIDRCTPHWNEKLQKYTLTWRIRLKDGKMLSPRRSQGRTKSEVRRRAIKTATSLLQTQGASTWKLSSQAIDFLDKVVKPRIEVHENARTKEQYLLNFHRVRSRVMGYEIGAITSRAALIRIIESVRTDVGYESARQTQNIISAYVVAAMLDNDLVDYNPIAGHTIPGRPKAKTTTTRIPTLAEWQATATYILDSDLTAPMPGRKSPASRKRTARMTHQRVAELTMLQMATGLRKNEACKLRWSDIDTPDKDGLTWVSVRAEVAKNGTARTVPILHPGIANYFQEVRQKSEHPVIPSPSDDAREWTRTNSTKAIAEYYQQLAVLVPIPPLEKLRSHVWRKTLNTAMVGRIDQEVRAKWFGHTKEENSTSYTALHLVRPAIELLA